MKGSIYTDRKCPVCGIRLKSLEPRGFFCPKHPRELHDGKCRVVFDNVTTRCENYREAYKILTRKRAEVDLGTYDVRDYKIKAKPLSIACLGQEWLKLKRTQVRPSSMPQLNNAIRRATNAWGEANIKSIKYAQIEDLFISLNDLAPKTRSNMLAALRQFWHNGPVTAMKFRLLKSGLNCQLRK